MTTLHEASGISLPCTRQALGRCNVCALTDRAGPRYSEHYRRLFYPAEFPDPPRAEPVWPTDLPEVAPRPCCGG